MDADVIPQGLSAAGRTRGQKLAALAGYILFTLVFFELVMRLAYSYEPFTVRTIGDDPLSWRRLWVWAQKKTGETLVFPTETYDPMLGWRNMPGLVDAPLGDGYLASTNLLGFRGREEVDPVKERPRILLLGDSYTFGDQANDDELFAAILRQRLPAAEVINLGVRGYGQDQMLLQFEQIGVGLEPDVVILGFLQMDMERNLLDFRNYAKPKFVVSDGELVLTNSPVDQPEQVLAEDWKRPRLLDLWVFFDGVITGYSGEKARLAADITGYILAGLTDAVRSAGAVPVFMYFPSDHDIRAYPAVPEGETYLYAFCDDHLDVVCSSAWDEFAAEIAGGTTYRPIGHWDAAGHRTAAEAILNLFHEQHLLP